MTTARWTVVIPVKAAAAAKSRLAVPAAVRPGLARAFASDTVAAALACAQVSHVTAVTDDALLDAALTTLGAEVLRRTLPLNDAVAAAADRVPGPVAAIPADLPALTPEDLAAALTAAERHRRAVVADRSGLGTVLLAARTGHDLLPAFGQGSFLTHCADGAVPLESGTWARLRCDVDTAEDLEEALRLGVGVATTRLLQG